MQYFPPRAAKGILGGSADTEPQPVRPAHVGTTRVGYAHQWVDAMTLLAPAGRSRIRLIAVPRVGHSSAGLTPACQRARAEQLGGIVHGGPTAGRVSARPRLVGRRAAD
jgi:hypothetical protein